MAENLDDKGIKFPHYEGLPVAVSMFLPFRQRFGLCDIETREEHFIEGELIHVFYLKNKFYCSQEFFERLIQENAIQTTGIGITGQG